MVVSKTERQQRIKIDKSEETACQTSPRIDSQGKLSYTGFSSLNKNCEKSDDQSPLQPKERERKP